MVATATLSPSRSLPCTLRVTRRTPLEQCKTARLYRDYSTDEYLVLGTVWWYSPLALD